MKGLGIRPLGEILRTARLDNKITQAQLGTALGVSDAYISSLERHDTVASKEFINTLLAYFKSRSYYIDPFELSVSSDMLRNKISLKHLSERHKKLVVQVATAELKSEQIDALFTLLKEIRT